MHVDKISFTQIMGPELEIVIYESPTGSAVTGFRSLVEQKRRCARGPGLDLGRLYEPSNSAAYLFFHRGCMLTNPFLFFLLFFGGFLGFS